MFSAFKKANKSPHSTTTAFVRLLRLLILDKKNGQYVVPIVPDEAQTFGMQTLFDSAKIYNPKGQKYDPLEVSPMAMYKEAADGQIFQEGINEAGAMATFTAAATSYATCGVQTAPFYIYYSMFGFQRVGDSIWAAADMLAKGFLIGGIAGRTTINGEGLQHADGHSLILAATVPSVVSYDPAFGYELAAIVKEGWRKMFVENEKLIFYLTVYNENYPHLAQPEGIEDGDILRGLYRLKKSDLTPKNEFETAAKTPVQTGIGASVDADIKVHLFGSGSILQQVLAAANILENEYKIATDIWSVTSYTELIREAQSVDNQRFLDPSVSERSLFSKIMSAEKGVIVAVSDWQKMLPQTLATWSSLPFTALGTDGFGLSESREALRDHFEISPKYIVKAALVSMFREGKIGFDIVEKFTI